MNDAARLAALCLVLASLGAASLSAIYQGTQPAPAPRVESWRNERVLMQSKANPSKWEALEVLASDPGQYHRTALTPAQARRWAEEGGFRQVSNSEYNNRLAIAAGYAMAKTRRSALASR